MADRSGGSKETSGIAQETARDAGVAAVGALVGVAIGGPPGAIVGAVVSPFLAGSYKLAASALQRRQKRAETIVTKAIHNTRLSFEELAARLEANDDLADSFLSLLNQTVQSDPSLDGIMSVALSEIVSSPTEHSRERILIITDAVKGLRSIHLKIMRTLCVHGGRRRASDIAEDVDVPEIELRGVVRELELRAMIKDLGVHPVEWRIRELGRAIMTFEAPQYMEG